MTSDLTDDPLVDKPDSLDQLKFDTPADSGSCWWSHKWGKWEDTDTGEIVRVLDETVVGKFIYQERRCIRCNKVELNKIKIIT